MSFLRFRLPAALSRGAVVAAFCCTTTAITAYIYSTRVGGNPTRIYKDKDGAWRMMTRHDVMILRIEVSVGESGVLACTPAELSCMLCSD